MLRNHRTAGRVLAVGAALALATGLAACSSSSSDASDAGSAAAGSSAAPAPAGSVPEIAGMVPESIASDGTITVAGAVYPPALIEGPDGPTGWDAETIKQVGEILGLNVEIQLIPFDNVVPGLQANKFDAAMGEIYITPERLETVDFVTTHRSEDSLLVPANSPIQSADDQLALCGLNLTAGSGSAEEALITETIAACEAAGKSGTKLSSFANVGQSNLALSQGRVDAAVNSTSQVAYTISQTGDQFRMVPLPWTQGYDTGIALARNADTPALAKAMQAAVNHMIENGQLQAILDEFNNGAGMIAESQILPPGTN